jgi:hypothetical protein
MAIPSHWPSVGKQGVTRARSVPYSHVTQVRVIIDSLSSSLSQSTLVYFCKTARTWFSLPCVWCCIGIICLGCAECTTLTHAHRPTHRTTAVTAAAATAATTAAATTTTTTVTGVHSLVHFGVARLAGVGEVHRLDGPRRAQLDSRAHGPRGGAVQNLHRAIWCRRHGRALCAHAMTAA